MRPLDSSEHDTILKHGAAVTTSSADDHGSQAVIAADHEHNLSFSEAVRSYPTAVFWSIFFSLGVIMAVSLGYIPSTGPT